MKICVLIPVYNESRTIGSLVHSLRAKDLDVIVIDDGSTDDSGLIAQQLGAKVIRHDKRNGKGYSLRQGFLNVLESGYDAAIAMDGDGQHAVSDIDQFLAKAEQNPNSIITGNRMVNAKGMPLVRFLTNRFMSFIISMACHQSVADTQCGYRFLSCDILKAIDLNSNEFEIETEILMKASKLGYKIYSVPVQTIYSREESKISPVKDTFRFISYFVKEIFSKGK